MTEASIHVKWKYQSNDQVSPTVVVPVVLLI
jgi:hypothetical protein